MRETPNFNCEMFAASMNESRSPPAMLVQPLWQPVSGFFLSVLRVRSSIMCPRCQRRCHNTRMRLHTFRGDFCGQTWALPTDQTHLEAWEDHQSAPQPGHGAFGAQTSHDNAQDARTFTHRAIGTNNEQLCALRGKVNNLSCFYFIVEFLNYHYYSFY